MFLSLAYQVSNLQLKSNKFSLPETIEHSASWIFLVLFLATHQGEQGSMIRIETNWFCLKKSCSEKFQGLNEIFGCTDFVYLSNFDSQHPLIFELWNKLSFILSGARAETNSRVSGVDGYETEGIRGLRALGVRDLSYRLVFLACCVAPTNPRVSLNRLAEVEKNLP